MPVKAYLKLIRPVHWVKNLLVLLPLLCSGRFLTPDRLISGLLAALAFSCLASSIYCINDVKDAAIDRQDGAKAGRPVASGAVRPAAALGCSGILLLLACGLGFLACGLRVFCWVAFFGYFILNVAYSFGLKNVALVDIAILAAGFLLRLLYGGMVTETFPSQWLCLTVIAGSFYMGLGKRRGELRSKGSRKVLKNYTFSFLDQNMYMCLGLTVVFYALWTVEGITAGRRHASWLVWTVPVVILILMRYSLDLETFRDGDPVEVLFHDWLLLVLSVGFVGALAVIVYG